MIDNEDKLIELCKILDELEVDKIQLNRFGWEYSYLSREKPKERVAMWETSGNQLGNKWWYWTY